MAEYQYRADETLPNPHWRYDHGWDVDLRTAVPWRPPGWQVWTCTRGKHRYHRSREAAYACAGLVAPIAPRIENIQIISGEVHFDG